MNFIFLLLFLLLPNLYCDLGKFIHITDIHYDPLYENNSSTNCLAGKLGLECCHKNSVFLNPLNKKKGSKWGDFNCDTSYLFINKTLEWIYKNIQPIDFIIYTGDSVDHHDFSQSIQNNINAINDINNLFKYYFPNKIVYSTIGNHDTFPIDQTPNHTNNIFLKNFAIDWNFWLKNSTDTNGGHFFYTINNSLTILSFDSLYYDTKNLFTNDEAENQWQWLKRNLEIVKNKKGKVWIINHICPFHKEASTDYNKKFIDIISDYKDIIKYQFYGHTHSDVFTLFNKNNSIVGFGSIPSSIMLDQHEASFRVYEYDRNNFDIINYHQYISDLEKIIKKNTMIYYKSYSFNEEYGLNGVNLENYINLYQKIKVDKNILKKYYNNIKPLSSKDKECDKKCKKKILDGINPI